MKNINRAELVERMSALTEQSKAATDLALWAFIESVQEAVAAGDKVTLVGFGVFESRAQAARPARTARNPQTGEAIEVAAAPESVMPRFRAGRIFKKKVRSQLSTHSADKY